MQNCFTSFNSLSDHSMSAAENRKTPISLLVNSHDSVASSGVRGWHWSGHVLHWFFAWPLPWLLLYRRLPWPNIPDICTLHRDSSFEKFLRSLSTAALALALYTFNHYISNKYVFFTLICILHQAVNSCTTFSSFCMPSGVSAKIEISSMIPTLLNW